MNKLIRYTFFAALIFIMNACSNDYVLPGEEPNHFVVYLSEEFFGNQTEVGGFIDFADVSQGVESRKWIFPEGLVEVDGEMITVTDKGRFRAFFMKSGVYEVRLEQQYAGDAWVGENQVGNVYDTAYMVTVLDSVVASFAAAVIPHPDSVDSPIMTLTPGVNNTIEAGSYVNFQTDSVGSPGAFHWFVEGSVEGEFEGIAGSPNNGSNVTFQFKSLGTYDVMMIASRARPAGADTVFYEDMITVGPSTKPVNVLDVWRQEVGTGQVNITLSRELEDPSSETGSFDVTIFTSAGGTINPAVTSVGLMSGDQSTLKLTLNEPLYSDDSVTISYTQGDLTTTDFYKVESFSDVLVGASKINLLVGYDMEAAPEETFGIGAWGGVWDMTTYEKTSTQAIQGSNSYLTTIAAEGAGIATGNGSLTVTREAGKTYELGLWLYIEEVGDGSGAMSVIFAGRNEWGEGVYFTNDLPVGEWFYHVVNPGIETIETTESTINLRPNNQTNPGPVVFYMDDITVKEVVNRP